MMDLLVTMNEVRPDLLPTSIFMTDSNFLAPVVIPTRFSDFQNMTMYFDEQENNPPKTQWTSWAGLASVGQYSFRKKCGAGVLGRWDIEFRRPSEEEMQADFNLYGEQIMGPKVSEVSGAPMEKWKHNASFEFFGDQHYFTGPDRIVRSVFSSRFFQGRIPEDLSSFVREIDELSPKDKMVAKQGYFLVHGNNGELRRGGGESPDDALRKMENYGHVELDSHEESMSYVPPGASIDEAIDFTLGIYKEN